MQPFRIVRSEAELEGVAPGSLVSAAYSLRTIFEKQNTNEWVEPGSEEEFPTAAVWELMTGAYETIILDEDREVWVLIDAAAPGLVRPPRGEDSPDYLTRARPGDRDTEWITHASLAGARAEIESLIGAGTAANNMLIYARTDKARIDFYPVEHIEAGAAATSTNQES
ncbi:hypothetical protein [Pseudarthrobacter sp. PH31-O2]|uniref:hypothetical protein n=1 Tax=Pseudarthrobacter sp. PH31-O2 TaxID=3046206 RepID=UPI0024BB2DD6|nr:hypothetical protein [Pseudarthrobacter sp. PH31-O2]MDJ0354459.1 hypothetical protein [Pseudarthrobacter sp. PH31-O2]